MTENKIPTHDPQTGELNPLYEELTGELNPLKKNKKLKKALDEFKNRYRSVTSADFQTFILGWKARDRQG